MVVLAYVSERAEPDPLIFTFLIRQFPPIHFCSLCLQYDSQPGVIVIADKSHRMLTYY